MTAMVLMTAMGRSYFFEKMPHLNWEMGHFALLKKIFREKIKANKISIIFFLFVFR